MPAIIRVVDGRTIIKVGENSALAAASATLAEQFANDANLSADAAALAAAAVGVYTTVGDGEAATTNGQSFYVASGGEVTLYINNAGTGDEVASLATASDVAARPTFTELASSNPGEGAALVGAEGGGTVQSSLDTSKADISRIDNTAPSPSGALWEPVAEPNANTYFDTGAGGDGATELYALWEVFRAEYPARITRTQIGTDESATYPIWAYTIAPVREARRKILLNCGSHGGELPGMLGVLRAMQQLVGDVARKDERVKWLNDYCTVIVVPTLNPWGLSQNPRDRNNANFVDLNRNFDFEFGPTDKWAAFTNSTTPGYGTKGTAPLSETETQALVDLVEDNPDIYHMADVHGFVSVGNGDLDALIYNPVWYLKSDRKGWKEFLRNYAGSSSDRISTEDDAENPNCNNSMGVRGVECVTPEYVPLSGEVIYSETSMTRCVYFHGNVILQMANGEQAKTLTGSQPFARYYLFSSVTGGLSTTETETYAVDTFTTERAGFLTFNGEIVAQSPTSTDIRVYVKPSIGQDSAIPSSFRHSVQSLIMTNSEDIPQGQKRRTIPFSFAMPIREKLTVNVGLKVWADVSADSSISTGSATVIFTPAEVGADHYKQLQPHNITGAWTERVPTINPLMS